LAVADCSGHHHPGFRHQKLRNVGTDLGGAVKGFKKAIHDEEKNTESDKEDSDKPHAKVSHEEPGNTYDVQAEEKQAANDRNEERK